MIQYLAEKHARKISICFCAIFYSQLIIAGGTLPNGGRKGPVFPTPGQKELSITTPQFTNPFINNVGDKKIKSEPIKSVLGSSGPSQPEMQSFQSVNSNNMVDLFSGDFSYNIPLMDVGGYPINIGYRSGVTMDQDASWVGLGWNINPGTITRSLRGLPDDFNGNSDTITQTFNMKENKTVGVAVAGDAELKGLPFDLGYNIGVFKNNYRGFGLETGLNASINVASTNSGSLTAGMAITNNSQEGLTISPSLAVSAHGKENEDGVTNSASLRLSLPYNSRSGIKALQLGGTAGQSITEANQLHQTSAGISSYISFATPAYTPTMQHALTTKQYTFTMKGGGAVYVLHPSLALSGYVTTQRIDKADQRQRLPAYGYLNFQNSVGNPSVLLDYNREKDIPYRETPAVPNIAIPSYTYDAFSITGEGTGGMFRAYRGDIGYVHDHMLRTKDESGRGSVDLGIGNLVHGGVDLNVTRAFTETNTWEEQNTIKNSIDFKPSSGLFEGAYFRNPGEKSINSKSFYDALGGDNTVAIGLSQFGNGPTITATNVLNKYKGATIVGTTTINSQNAVKQQRDKRSQVISYLTAKEASKVGLNKYIENYAINQFVPASCFTKPTTSTEGTGLKMEYYNNTKLSGNPVATTFGNIDLPPSKSSPNPNITGFENFGIKWTGFLLAPRTGTYHFAAFSDNLYMITINDLVVENTWGADVHKVSNHDTFSLNLVAGEKYAIEVKFMNYDLTWGMRLSWTQPGLSEEIIPTKYFYASEPTEYTDGSITREERINSYRQPGHISEIDVLNPDGRRYVYGIPVYNLKQKEATFAVEGGGSVKEGLVKYNSTGSNPDNSPSNIKGIDNYFNSNEVPAYAHSYLLSGILSPDYVDVTGDGITDDDPGDAIKFNYSKIASVGNPFKWRAPYIKDSATYNQGLVSENRDDKGSYVYGEKELWYLNAVISKNMIATFKVSDRKDLLPIDENGVKSSGEGYGKKLDEINLYTKADFLKNGVNARPVKTVHFEYTYELCMGVNRPFADSGKLTLKKIWFSYNGNNKGKLNPYVFYYNAKNPGYNLNLSDRWGTYKDPLQNPGSSSGNLINNAEYAYALQDSALAALNVAAWTLDSMKLPSGGQIKVTYESDDYAYVQNMRAAQMFRIAGLSFAPPTSVANTFPLLYNPMVGDNLYVSISVSSPVASNKDVFEKYLAGLNKLYFRLNVKMPSDVFGSGNEYIPVYAGLDIAGGYGYLDANTIWVKLKSIDNKGIEDAGSVSPLAKAALQFLRLNLPSKAFPGSETSDNPSFDEVVKVLASQATNITESILGYDATARKRLAACRLDLSRSWVRLNTPDYKKYGGGLRVKRITIYDNWNKMTGQKESTYGQEYEYTTTENINGKDQVISSGVATWEPSIGGEENPFRLPVEYIERVAPLAPVTLGYTEEPLGESFYPSASVGYSKVRVRSIHIKNARSANGMEETTFFTAKDFPVVTDRTPLIDGKKRYNKPLSELLRINVKNYIAVSQGFKVELNDMHGKMRSQATYAQNSKDPLSYTENFYKTETDYLQNKKLNNTVWTIDENGQIDTTALIGKDVELMTDMRYQRSLTNANNANANVDFFTIGTFPAFMGSFIDLPQQEERIFKSAGMTKIIQRYGILDSIVHVEKGSKVSTKNLLYDSETGEVLLTRTQNEFNDPIYNFTYPSHWAYDGMAGAYKNIGAIFQHLKIKDGKILEGLPMADSLYFTSGDEVLIASKPKTDIENPNSCNDIISQFAAYSQAWVVDANILSGGLKQLHFIDRDGVPFTGNDVAIKIIRSGRRNINASVGQISMMANPLVRLSGGYKLQIDTNSKVINAASTEFQQGWKVEDLKKRKWQCN